MFDLVIKNGTIIDGSKTPAYRGDVGIRGDRIVALGQLEIAESQQVIDASGKIVAPGFVDVHTHADGWLLKTPNFYSKTSQGFTTEVIMADGISYAPVNPDTASEWLYYMRTLNGLRFSDYEGWESIADYMALLDRRTAQNSIPHVPYANVRTLACGFGRYGPDDVQMNQIIAEIEKGMDAGAVGLSTGLDYIVQCHATTDELVEACRAIAPQQGLYVTHIRYKKGIIKGVMEAVEIGKRAGVPVHISHLKGQAQGQGEIDDELLTYIDQVATQEVDFSFDVYPYMASSTMLNSLFPYEIWADGPLRVFEKLRQPAIQRRIAAGLQTVDLNSTYIAWLPSKQNSHYQGQSLAHYCTEVGLPPAEACTNLLIEENLAVLLVFRLDDNDALVNSYLSHSHFMLGSDGIYQEGGIVHPRQYGSATRLIGPLRRDHALFSLEEAIYKLSAFPAERFGLLGRGTIKEGNFADLVIFDAQSVSDRATLEQPQQLSTGIEHVIVNGVPIITDSQPIMDFPQDPPGRALRFKQAK
ncbi:MAG: N-acyl-D-amino-acid deacylase family protein [Ardenticatenaceae bacterium]